MQNFGGKQCVSIDYGRCANGEYCKKGTLCHGQGLARALYYPRGRTQELKQQVTSRLLLIFSSVLQQFLVIRSLQVVVQKSTLDRNIRLLVGIPGLGNAS